VRSVPGGEVNLILPFADACSAEIVGAAPTAAS
jgi:hypothetical protein